jgi:hypothetical protein
MVYAVPAFAKLGQKKKQNEHAVCTSRFKEAGMENNKIKQTT